MWANKIKCICGAYLNAYINIIYAEINNAPSLYLKMLKMTNFYRNLISRMLSLLFSQKKML